MPPGFFIVARLPASLSPQPPGSVLMPVQCARPPTFL